MEIVFKLIPGRNYHKDFFIKVGKEEFFADSYYYWSEEFNQHDNSYEAIHKRITQYLSKWAEKLKILQKDKEVFVPIDFSDEYVGGFKIRVQCDRFIILYGFIVDINNLMVQVKANDIITNLDDKEVEPVIHFEMEKESFLNTLSVTIEYA